MIDRTQLRQTMRKALLVAANKPNSGFPPQATGYAWENRNYEPPAGGSIWIRETLMPISEVLTSADLIQFDGFFQYDVMSNKGDGTEVSAKIVKAIGDVFKPGSSLTDPLKVHIMRTEPLQGSGLDSWWMDPVRIRILAYSLKG